MQNKGKEAYKKVCCTCKVALLLIRVIVVFTVLQRFISPFSITRFYVLFEQTLNIIESFAFSPGKIYVLQELKKRPLGNPRVTVWSFEILFSAMHCCFLLNKKRCYFCKPVKGALSLCHTLSALLVTGSLSNDDGNGSENVTQKVNSCCFKLHRSYSNSLNLSNVGEFFRS